MSTSPASARNFHTLIQSAIADIHKRIAREMAEQIADSLTDETLRDCFRACPLPRELIG